MIPNVNDLYNIELGKFVFSRLNNTLPPPLTKIYIQNMDIHAYNTRNHLGLHISPIKVDVVFRSFVCQGPILWSNIPHALKSVCTMKGFASKLKRFYITDYA